MSDNSRLYATQEQQAQQRNQNDSGSQIRRRIFYHRRPSKYFILLLILLSVHAVYNVEDEPNDMQRILWNQNNDNAIYNGHGRVNARRRDNEVSFKSINTPSTDKHTSKATITLVGIDYDMPKEAVSVFEEALYNALLNKDGFTVVDVHITKILSFETTADVDEQTAAEDGDDDEEDGDDDEEDGDDDDREDGGDDDREDGAGEEDDDDQERAPQRVSNTLRVSNYEQQRPNTEIVWGDHNRKKRRGSQTTETSLTRQLEGSGKLRLEVVITYHLILSDPISSTLEALLWDTLDSESSNIVGALQDDNYYQHLKRLECTDVVNMNPGAEDIKDAKPFSIPPTRRITNNPTVESASFVTREEAPKSVGGEASTPVGDEAPTPVEGAYPTSHGDTISNVSSKRSTTVRSKAERYRNASACVFAVTLIIIAFWNMVRLNRKQIERRRRKVTLAKIAYEAPLSMTNGLMDMGVPARFAPPTQNYNPSALDEDNYLGTMDKNTTVYS